MNRFQFLRPSSRAISLVLVMAMMVGCAQVNTNGIRRHKGRRLPSPRALVIYDFEQTGASIGLNGTAGTGDTEDGLSTEELANRDEVGRVLADVLAKELEERGILTSRKRGPIGVPPETMAIGGQIITVDDGSRAKRIFIGFGVGKSRMTSAAQLYALKATGPEIVWEYQNTTASGPKPGILTTLPIGAAIQGVTLMLLVVNGGMSTMGELSSSSTSNAKRMAEELAEAVEETLETITTRR